MINGDGQGSDKFLPLKLELRTQKCRKDLFRETFGFDVEVPIGKSNIPTPPQWNPKKPKTQAELMALLKGHIRAKMIPPPPFTKAMGILAPVVE